MKQIPLSISSVFIVLAVSLMSCASGDDDISSGMFSYILGDLTEMEEERIFFSAENTQLDIRLESDSLCPDYGVELIITGNGVDYENSVISQFPYTDLLTIPSNATIMISTKIVALPNTMVNCVTLGNVTCVFEY